MSQKDNNESANHAATVRHILESAEQTWQALLQLEAADDINPDGVFIPRQNHGEMHAQKIAHIHVIGYQQRLANKTYTVRASNLWQDPITDERGNPIEVRVPKSETVSIDGSGGLSIDDVGETRVEKVTPETLHHRWSQRFVTVERMETGSWGEQRGGTETQRVWLPPRAISGVFDRLEDVRTKIGFGAEVATPDWRSEQVLDPSDGVRKPHE